MELSIKLLEGKIMRNKAFGSMAIMILVDVALWIVFFLTSSGLVGMISILILILILAIVAGLLGADPSKIKDKNKEEYRIRRETRIKLDEAKKHYDNWKFTKK